MARAPVLAALLLVLVAVVGSANAQLPTYTGPKSFMTQDVNSLHTPAECTAAPGSPNGCVPFTVTLPISTNTSMPFALTYPSLQPVETSSGPAAGTISGGSTILNLLLPWGNYTLTFTFGTIPVVAKIQFVVYGFVDISNPASQCGASDAKYGVPPEDGLRWCYLALQANNSVFTPGIAAPWYTGSATHYHQGAYWRLMMPPGPQLVSFAKVVQPYFADGSIDLTATLLNLFPTRTVNLAMSVEIGYDPFYASTSRKKCVNVGHDPAYPAALTAASVWVCPPTYVSHNFVITATQIVPPLNANQTALLALLNGNPPANPPLYTIEDFATHLCLVFVQVFGPYLPSYTLP